MATIIDWLVDLLRLAYQEAGIPGVVCLVGGAGLGTFATWFHFGKRNKSLTDELEKSREQLNRLVNDKMILDQQDEAIWDRDLTESAAGILPPPAGRRAVLVAFFNLKGGVGKTTLAAHLGAELAGRPNKKVLLLDLDHQQSLSKLCLTISQWEQLREKSLSTAGLFKSEQPMRGQPFADCFWHVSGWGNVFQIAPAKPELAEVETNLMVRWLRNNLTEDVRLRIARTMSDLVQEFDFIFFDCPPRFTTASVNALSASDFIVAPVGPGLLASDPIPGLVKQLERMRAVTGRMLDKSIGLVVNMVDGRSGVSSNYLSEIISQCPTSWQGRMHGFQTKVTRLKDYSSVAEDRGCDRKRFAMEKNEKARTQVFALAEELAQCLHKS